MGCDQRLGVQWGRSAHVRLSSGMGCPLGMGGGDCPGRSYSASTNQCPPLGAGCGVAAELTPTPCRPELP